MYILLVEFLPLEGFPEVKRALLLLLNFSSVAIRSLGTTLNKLKNFSFFYQLHDAIFGHTQRQWFEI